MKRFKPLQTGLEMIYGIPGSGKSLVALRRLLEVMTELRRPVYTNLPLQFPVVRAWLRKRGGPVLARLIVPLDEAHFRAFISRFQLKRALVDKYRLLGLRQTAAEAAFYREHGPDITRGPGANWIPAGAVICIDEVHHWFPNPAINKSATPETPALMAYLTMHRHLQQWIWAVTQDPRQVSTTFKSIAKLHWKVWAKDAERLVFGITFRSFGLRALAYAAYSPEQWNDGDPHAQPAEQFLIFPQLPNTRWLFRLYRSFTHCGSASALRRQLERARIESGLDASGGVANPAAAPTVNKGLSMSLLSKVAKFGFASVAFACVGIAAFAVGRAAAPEPLPVDPTASAETVAPARITDPRALKLRSVLHDVVVFDDDTHATIGDTVCGITICAIDGVGCAGVDAAGGMWVWRKGYRGASLGAQSEVEQLLDHAAPGWRRGKPGIDLKLSGANDPDRSPPVPGIDRSR
jgi:hypothetical protein